MWRKTRTQLLFSPNHTAECSYTLDGCVHRIPGRSCRAPATPEKRCTSAKHPAVGLWGCWEGKPQFRPTSSAAQARTLAQKVGHPLRL